MISRSEIAIGQRVIGPNHPPFLIAEMSGNHGNSLDKALQLVDAAADSGATGFKLQTYKPDTMTLELTGGDFVISDPKSLWNGRTLFDLYVEAQTPWEWHAPIFERAKKRGMIPFSTPFDESAVDFLETLNTQCYKIASFEITDLELIARVAKTQKPLIISTGMASLEEISDAVSIARVSGCPDIILLKCVSAYPAPASEINLSTIGHMSETFDCMVGLSDHTLGIGVAVGAVALGAVVIEKHFTLNRGDGGVDSAFSLEPEEFRSMAEEVAKVQTAIGRVTYGVNSSEVQSLKFRRSLYIAEDIEPGDVFTEKNVRAIRPGYGLHPKFAKLFYGKRVKNLIRKGTPLSWDHLG